MYTQRDFIVRCIIWINTFLELRLFWGKLGSWLVLDIRYPVVILEHDAIIH